MSQHTGSDQPTPSAPDVGEAQGDASTETRRAAVQRLGKYAAYTAPALIALLTASTSASAS